MNGFIGQCHCGAVRINTPEPPEKVLKCNCSLCRKTGWIGGFYDPSQVAIDVDEDALVRYEQGDKTITVWHCANCGSTTHWTPLTAPPDRMGVNMRMFDWKDWKHVPVTTVDGASI